MNELKDFAPQIVPFNKCASFCINVKGLSKEVNKSISRACFDVARNGSNHSCEFLVMVNVRTGNWDYKEKGTANSVGGEEFWSFVDSASDKYVFVHNHSSGNMFSYSINLAWEIGSITMYMREKTALPHFRLPVE